MKYFLDKKYIPMLPKKSDKWVTAKTKEDAVHKFAVRIAQAKFAEHAWRAQLPEIKKEISSYVYPMEKKVEELNKKLGAIVNLLEQENSESFVITRDTFFGHEVYKKIAEELGDKFFVVLDATHAYAEGITGRNYNMSVYVKSGRGYDTKAEAKIKAKNVAKEHKTKITQKDRGYGALGTFYGTPVVVTGKDLKSVTEGGYVYWTIQAVVDK